MGVGGSALLDRNVSAWETCDGIYKHEFIAFFHLTPRCFIESYGSFVGVIGQDKHLEHMLRVGNVPNVVDERCACALAMMVCININVIDKHGCRFLLYAVQLMRRKGANDLLVYFCD